MPSEIVRVEFNGQMVECVPPEEGRPVLVSVRRICENLGLGFGSQTQKLRTAGWATVTMTVTVGEDGKARQTLCIPLDQVPMWLATTHASKVRPEVQPVLLRYQIECRDVLARHFGLVRDPEERYLARRQASEMNLMMNRLQAAIDRADRRDAEVKAALDRLQVHEPPGSLTQASAGKIRGMIETIAGNHHVTFQAAHGLVRKKYNVAGYLHLPESKVSEVLHFLADELAKTTREIEDRKIRANMLSAMKGIGDEPDPTRH